MIGSVWFITLNDRRRWQKVITIGGLRSFLNNNLETKLSVPILCRNEKSPPENELKLDDLRLFRFMSKSLASESELRSKDGGKAVFELASDR